MPHSIRNIQSPYVEADFWTQHNSGNPRMCLMVKVTPNEFWVNTDPLGFTSNTRDMTMPGHAGVTFKSAPGMSPTTIEQSLDLATNLELMGIYRAGSFSEAEVMAGKWDFARIEVFTVCWNNVNLGEFVHHDGLTGEFKDYQSHFAVETRGKLSLLVNQVGVETSKRCRVKEFRDAECKHSASQVTIEGTAYNIEQTLTVASVANDGFVLVFTKLAGTANDVPDGFFAPSGKITANTTAVDLGEISREVTASDTEATTITVALRRKFPFTVNIGDTFDLVAGCDHTVDDCKLYGNIINGRFEPYIPNIEQANKIRRAG